MAQSDVDVLIDVKNFYFIGNYQQCINEAQKLKNLGPEQTLVRDVFMYRAFIALRKFTVVLDEVAANAPKSLQPLRLLAEFLSAPPGSKRDAVVEKLDKLVTAGFTSEDATEIVIAGMIYYHCGDYEGALRVLNQGDHLECSALTIQTLLAFDRVDLAKKELKNMQEKDEDATLTQLASGWVALATGGDKYQEAFYIVQEMVDKYGSTPLLLNMLAVCYIAQGKYTDADTSLQEALEKDPNSADALINLFMTSSFVGKAPEVSNRFLSQLKDAHPNHPFVQDYYKKESEFEMVAKIFSKA